MVDGLNPPYGQSPWIRDYTVLPVVVQTSSRNDYVGSYTAYIYSDGHVETDPPGRPLYKEDVQRTLLAQLAIANPSQFLKIASAGTTDSGQLALQNAARVAANTRTADPEFHDSITGMSEVTDTFTASAAYRANLMVQVDLGG